MTLDRKALCYGKNLKQEREGIRIRAAETGIRIQIITEFLTCGLNNRASLPVGAHPELGPGAVLVQIKKIRDEIVISPRIILDHRFDSKNVTHSSYSMPVVCV